MADHRLKGREPGKFYAEPVQVEMAFDSISTQAFALMIGVEAHVAAVAAGCGLSPLELDWHVEAEHGWEPHDLKYNWAVYQAARCLLSDTPCQPPRYEVHDGS